MNLLDHIQQLEQKMKGVLSESTIPTVGTELKEGLKIVPRRPLINRSKKADKGNSPEEVSKKLDEPKAPKDDRQKQSPYTELKIEDITANEETSKLPRGDTGGTDGMRDMISMFSLDDDKGWI